MYVTIYLTENKFNVIVITIICLLYREGHSKPPNMVQHCEPTGENLLSAGSDSSLHIMNTVTETFNKNMGKASYCRKISKKKSKFCFKSLKSILLF